MEYVMGLRIVLIMLIVVMYLGLIIGLVTMRIRNPILYAFAFCDFTLHLLYLVVAPLTAITIVLFRKEIRNELNFFAYLIVLIAAPFVGAWWSLKSIPSLHGEVIVRVMEAQTSKSFDIEETENLHDEFYNDFSEFVQRRFA
ncbi:hypothetical protein CBW65_04890 [Tumebacillus avium]|uniref:Uncharacterized protein n=1 Tax=Tumebacillus avium TaxID=1903704 RepID=A0A1Y0IJ08_9BACL|nr:hypothetical protein [Tumebacillus avium]ARU60482.1 hypothetical protein CBW65_04890 [Tumebacillus avium]